MDVFEQSAKRFVGDLPGLIQGDRSRVTSERIWSIYIEWTYEQYEPRASRAALASALVDAGAVRIKNSSIRYDLTPLGKP